jgi:hypothetical protein
MVGESSIQNRCVGRKESEQNRWFESPSIGYLKKAALEVWVARRPTLATSSGDSAASITAARFMMKFHLFQISGL